MYCLPGYPTHTSRIFTLHPPPSPNFEATLLEILSCVVVRASRLASCLQTPLPTRLTLWISSHRPSQRHALAFCPPHFCPGLHGIWPQCACPNWLRRPRPMGSVLLGRLLDSKLQGDSKPTSEPHHSPISHLLSTTIFLTRIELKKEWFIHKGTLLHPTPENV